MIKYKNENLRYGFVFECGHLQKIICHYEYFIDITLHSGRILDLFGCNDNYVYEEEYDKLLMEHPHIDPDIYEICIYNKILLHTLIIPCLPIKLYFDNTIQLQKESTPLFYHGYLISGFVTNYHKILKSIVQYNWSSIDLPNDLKKLLSEEIKYGV